MDHICFKLDKMWGKIHAIYIPFSLNLKLGMLGYELMMAKKYQARAMARFHGE